VSLTPNPASSRSGSDTTMTLSSEDLFGRKRQMWASCSDWVQTIILKNIRETIKAKIQKEHRIWEDRGEGFTDDGAAVAAEVQSQPSSLPLPCGTPRIQSQLSSRPPHVGLHGFTVKLPATCVLGPWGAPWITETIPRKLLHLPISARHRPPGSSPFSIPICRRRTAHSRWP